MNINIVHEYHATIRHHSISRAHVKRMIVKSLAAAKRAATKEFGDGFLDHEIVITDEFGNEIASRRIGRKSWRDLTNTNPVR